MDVSVFGTGYVGLVQAATMADVGHRVVCVDIDANKIKQLQRGVPTIHEPGLSTLLEDNLKAGRLAFSTQPSDAVNHGEVIFIAVGTPPDEDGSADLSHVLTVTRDIVAQMTCDRTLVIKSTVPVGTAHEVERTALTELERLGKQHLQVRVVSNPEFLKEGSAVNDCMRPDRIIVGTEDELARTQMAELYAPFCRNHDKLMWMDNRSAELTKYAANAMLATRISFMNELANLAERLGADIEAVRKGIGSDPRIGYHFIYPGCGFGGSCFPKDIRALLHTAERSGMPLRLLQTVSDINDQQRHILLAKLREHFPEGLAGKAIAVWGLAFKPNTDDMREAPSRVLLRELIERGATVAVHDPVAMPEARRVLAMDLGEDLLPRIRFCEGPMEALDEAEALVIVTEWKAFRSPDFEQIKERLKNPVIIDGRNLFEPALMHDFGIDYEGIGRSVLCHK